MIVVMKRTALIHRFNHLRRRYAIRFPKVAPDTWLLALLILLGLVSLGLFLTYAFLFAHAAVYSAI